MWTEDNHLYGTDAAPEFDERRRMAAVWMRRKPADPEEGVRVFITLEALWQLESGSTHDVATALSLFERYRHKIEVRAAGRFFARGPEPNEFCRGRPIVVFTTSDLS